MDKIKFARLISMLSNITHREFDNHEITDIDSLITEAIQSSPNRAITFDVDALLAAMGQPNKKIEAIKQYRSLTGLGFKESKDAVEKYWIPVTMS